MNGEISNIIIMLSSEPENEKLELQFFLLRKETGRKGKKKKKYFHAYMLKYSNSILSL
jgi:hypothetical protein